MDMGSTTTATGTVVDITTAMSTGATAESATGIASAMGGMGKGGGSSCKISMLWNWYTVDACFISSTWQVTSAGMFAGSCIGVICLVMSLAFFRRLHRTYDTSIARDFRRRYESVGAFSSPEGSSTENNLASANEDGVTDSAKTQAHLHTSRKILPALGKKRVVFRPSLLQMIFRAALHTVEFAIAYFIMLLAMYFNGYIIICILIGAFLGHFAFDWEISEGFENYGDATEVTGCCG